MKKIFLILCVCLSISNAHADIIQDDIEIKNAWVRKSLGNAKMTSAYMEIINHNDTDIEITHVTTEIAKLSEIHDMTHQDGIMRMRKLDSLIVPANHTMLLSPEGKHIMLIHLTKKLSSGDKINMKIFIKNNPTLEIQLDVR